MRDEAKRIIRAIGVETGRVEHPVRGRSEDRPAGRHRDEPAGVALLGAGLEGHRLSDRQDRGAAGRRLPRWTRSRTRASRKRRRPPSSRRFDYVVVKIPRVDVREVSPGRRAPDDPDEVGRRSHGDRAHFPRGPRQGGALADRPGPASTTARAPLPREELLAKLEEPTAEPALPPAWPRLRSPACRSRTWRRTPGSIRGSWTGSAGWSRPRRGSPAARSPGSAGEELAGAAKRLGPLRPDLARSRWRRASSRSAPGAASFGIPRRSSSWSIRAPPSLRLVTPYYYSTYEDEDDGPRGQAEGRDPGGGPIASARESSSTIAVARLLFALARAATKSVMVNSNPETVSTDYDTSDRLFFEPLTVEDVLNSL